MATRNQNFLNMLFELFIRYVSDVHYVVRYLYSDDIEVYSLKKKKKKE